MCSIFGWLKIYFRLVLFTDSTKHISWYPKMSYVICVNYLTSFNLQKIVCSSVATDYFWRVSYYENGKEILHLEQAMKTQWRSRGVSLLFL